MIKFEEEIKNVYRLKIPFEELYTSVFLVKSEVGLILVDCATTDFDVDEYLIPALQTLGYELSDVGILVLTHKHTDHAGGRNRVLFHSPNIKVITKSAQIDGNIFIYEMPGHTRDFIGVFDKRTNTLISGDGIQGLGVGKYRCSLEDSKEYEKCLTSILEDNKIRNILFSHAYKPWNSDKALGRSAVEERIFFCLKNLESES